MLDVLAVIPARGGSRGLPGKNLVEVGGRSLVARAVQAAAEAESVTRIIGSTDNADIAEALKRAGAEVPVLRPFDLAGDDVPDSPVFLHMLSLLEEQQYRPDIVVNVRPTAPLRTGQHIDNAVDALLACPEARSVKSVSLAREHPYKMWALKANGLIKPMFPRWRDEFGGDPDVPRQTLPVVYRSNGAVDAVWAKALVETGAFHPGPVAAYVMDARVAVDIDSFDDVLFASANL